MPPDSDSPGLRKRERLQQFLPWICTATVFLCLALAYFLSEPFRDFLQEAWEVFRSEDRERMQSWISQFGVWGAIILILSMTAQMFLIVLPSLLIMVIAVLAYGPVVGVLITVAGVLLASSIGYVLGRTLSEAAISRLIGKKTEKKLRDEIEHYGFWIVVVCRINPILSNDAISFVAGMLALGFGRFILATFIGILPLAILISLFSDSLDTMKWGVVIVSLAGLIGIGAKAWWDIRQKHRRAPDEPARSPAPRS